MAGVRNPRALRISAVLLPPTAPDGVLRPRSVSQAQFWPSHSKSWALVAAVRYSPAWRPSTGQYRIVDESSPVPRLPMSALPWWYPPAATHPLVLQYKQ